MNARELLMEACRTDDAEKREKVKKVIYRVNGWGQRLILEQRYLYGRSWKYISSMTGLDMVWVRRLQLRAIKSVQRILDSTPEYEEES